MFSKKCFLRNQNWLCHILVNLSTEKLASSGARKTGLPTKITPELRQKLAPFSDKTTPQPDKNLPPISPDPLRPNGFRGLKYLKVSY